MEEGRREDDLNSLPIFPTAKSRGAMQVHPTTRQERKLLEKQSDGSRRRGAASPCTVKRRGREEREARGETVPAPSWRNSATQPDRAPPAPVPPQRTRSNRSRLADVPSFVIPSCSFPPPLAAIWLIFQRINPQQLGDPQLRLVSTFQPPRSS